MTADIIQFIPRPNPNREKEIERQAIEIMTAVMSGDPVPVGMEPVIHIPFGGQGIDGMWTDTAPSEYCAPEKDPA